MIQRYIINGHNAYKYTELIENFNLITADYLRNGHDGEYRELFSDIDKIRYSKKNLNSLERLARFTQNYIYEVTTADEFGFEFNNKNYEFLEIKIGDDEPDFRCDGKLIEMKHGDKGGWISKKDRFEKLMRTIVDKKFYNIDLGNYYVSKSCINADSVIFTQYDPDENKLYFYRHHIDTVNYNFNTEPFHEMIVKLPLIYYNDNVIFTNKPLKFERQKYEN